jgi:hypothetical protein
VKGLAARIVSLRLIVPLLSKINIAQELVTLGYPRIGVAGLLCVPERLLE